MWWGLHTHNVIGRGPKSSLMIRKILSVLVLFIIIIVIISSQRFVLETSSTLTGLTLRSCEFGCLFLTSLFLFYSDVPLLPSPLAGTLLWWWSLNVSKTLRAMLAGTSVFGKFYPPVHNKLLNSVIKINCKFFFFAAKIIVLGTSVSMQNYCFYFSNFQHKRDCFLDPIQTHFSWVVRFDIATKPLELSCTCTFKLESVFSIVNKS